LVHLRMVHARTLLSGAAGYYANAYIHPPLDDD